jgi:general secretion pathway protein H
LNQKGFTLVELLVALAIMALMLGISMPFLRGTPGMSLEQAARRIAAELRDARGTAMRHSRTVAFAVDTVSGRFGHDRLETLPKSQPPIVLSVYTTRDQRRSVVAGTIRFFPDGGSTGGGITLQQGDRRVQLLVDWLTGRVSLAHAGKGTVGE